MRLGGWESRLWQVIEAARSRPYVLGEHDCFRVACRVVEALTGVDRWPEFEGYRTKREALVKLAQFGSSFEAAGDWFFGESMLRLGGPGIPVDPIDARIDVRLARRGDICCVETVDGEKHLGVCLGRDTALLAPEGLTYLSTLLCRCAWRIG